MNKRLFLLVPTLLAATLLLAQTGYNIPITIKPYKNTYVYLGHHYGKRKALADSALLDVNGKGAFKGSKPLSGGIYFVVSPKKEILFEILIDKQQHFSIEADSATMPAGIKFTNSPDNSLFLNYTLAINEAGRRGAEASQALPGITDAAKIASLRKEIQQQNEVVLKYRDSIAKKFPQQLPDHTFTRHEGANRSTSGKTPRRQVRHDVRLPILQVTLLGRRLAHRRTPHPHTHTGNQAR